MKRPTGRGALVGFVVGAALVVLSILLPAVIRDDYYEIGDPLLFMGVPLVVMAVAAGTLVGGLAGTRRTRNQGTSDATRRTMPLIVVMTIGTVAACLLILTVVTGIV